MFTDKQVVLASQSPRRKQLLEQAGVRFSVIVQPVSEHFQPGMPAEAIPADIASRKAFAVVQQAHLKDHIVIAADTLVVLGEEIIGKPGSRDDAIRILSSLSGKMHRVITGVAMLYQGRQIVFSDTTEVYFRRLHPDQIGFYVDHYQPYDKAGAYAIQEWIGLIGVEKINGCYYNVMGLPVSRVVAALGQF